jgi:hypothetical protein
MSVKFRPFRQIANEFCALDFSGAPVNELFQCKKKVMELADYSDETCSYMGSDLRARTILTHKKTSEVLAKWHAAGYDTYDKFCNAVLAVFPELDYADLWCYFDLLQPDWFMGLKVEQALRILKPTF